MLTGERPGRRAALSRTLVAVQPWNDDWSYHVVGLDEDEVLAADARGTAAPGTTGCYEITIADGDQLSASYGEGGFWIGPD